MANLSDRIKVFEYVPALDCFIIDGRFQRIADYLGLNEWHAAVWIGRTFMLDNDYGEHWFDNWDERAALKDRAAALGYDSNDLMIVAPDRMQNGKDGPCHTSEFRKLFWTDVLRSLRVSFELIFMEARAFNQQTLEFFPEDHIEDLEERIRHVLLE